METAKRCRVMGEALEEQTESKAALRRKRERQQRRRSILGAAENLFAGKGFHATSMEEVADLAEVSVGTLYFYFKNKRDLLVALLDQISRKLRTIIGSEFRKADATLESFSRAGRAFFHEFCMQNPEKMHILLRESVGQGPEVEERRRMVFDKVVDDIMGALSRISENVGFSFSSHLSIRVIVVSTVGVFERVAYQYLIWQGHSVDLETAANDAISFLIGGMRSLIKE